MNSSMRPLWALLHILVIATILASLGSGLRIAILEHPYLLHLHNILPQGEVHALHLYAGLFFTLIAVAFIYLKIRHKASGATRAKSGLMARYHTLIDRLLYVLAATSVITGWTIYFDYIPVSNSAILFVHYLSALGFLLYFFLHGAAYFIQFGIKVTNVIFSPLKRINSSYAVGILSASVLALSLTTFFYFSSTHDLEVKKVPLDYEFVIDGKADEAVWQDTSSITLQTHGGVNFFSGETPVTVKVITNEREAYFLFQWQDATKSLEHLPLIKTADGWQVKSDGFKDFSETRFYEDKFAVILSDQCSFGAASTAHLGARPLKDKPAHWSGQGYHYLEEGMVDLWHWKALRSNAMRQIDDNFIGEPDYHHSGDRRYTAGYQTDAKIDGGYRMNWKWFYPDKVTPKRLPLSEQSILAYQPGNEHLLEYMEMPWILSWHETEPYSADNDTLPVGTVMPSILYSSNQYRGDRGDVRAYGHWEDGAWTLEVFRKLDTGSENDVVIGDGLCLWVAAFDQAQIEHTRHVRAIRLVFES